MKKISGLFLSILLLTSCNDNQIRYQNFLGNMYVSNARKSFLTISDKIINDRYDIGTYYGDVYSFDIDDRTSFFKEEDIVFLESEKSKFDDYNDVDVFYFFVQIPKGYQAYKRDNVQGYLNQDKEVLLTDNFYYFINKDIYYCDVDIVKNSNYIEPYVFSFYFLVNKDLNVYIKTDEIRINYYLHSS